MTTGSTPSMSLAGQVETMVRLPDSVCPAGKQPDSPARHARVPRGWRRRFCIGRRSGNDHPEHILTAFPPMTLRNVEILDEKESGFEKDFVSVPQARNRISFKARKAFPNP
jgi:hypothetical protein